MFGVAAVAVELVRPSFVDYLLPIWIIFVVAAVAGIISVINKPQV